MRGSDGHRPGLWPNLQPSCPVRASLLRVLAWPPVFLPAAPPVSNPLIIFATHCHPPQGSSCSGGARTHVSALHTFVAARPPGLGDVAPSEHGRPPSPEPASPQLWDKLSSEPLQPQAGGETRKQIFQEPNCSVPTRPKFKAFQRSRRRVTCPVASSERLSAPVQLPWEVLPER